MLRVEIEHAKPGMVLALPVYQPRRHDTVLLAAGVSLKARHIARLREINLKEVWIRYPGMEFVAEYVSPEVFEARARLTARVGEVFDSIAADAHARLDYARYRDAVSGLLDRLLAAPRAAMFVEEMADTDEPALRHASSVCFLSVLMGLKLEGYLVAQRSRLHALTARDVTSLGVGAMLHDVGMLRLDPAVLDRWAQTLDESDEQWRAHVTIGYEMVRGTIGPAAAAAVLHHHQHFDGSGFPRRRTLGGAEAPCAGRDIHIFARIICAADLFDRVRNPPLPAGHEGARERAPAVRALRMLREAPYRNWIDPMVFKALLAVAPAYAPGTMVELSDGMRGAVVEWFPDDPCRPTVQEVDLDAPRGRARARRAVLRGQSAVSVVRAEGMDVSADNFYPSRPGEFDLALAGRLLFNRAAGEGRESEAKSDAA